VPAGFAGPWLLISARRANPLLIAQIRKGLDGPACCAWPWRTPKKIRHEISVKSRVVLNFLIFVRKSEQTENEQYVARCQNPEQKEKRAGVIDPYPLK
jgi:hypothetical protein